MKEKRFQRRIEDFVCSQCGTAVVGNGYTNHCPKCLWSKHVDVNPGDRAATCGGAMMPIGLVIERGEQIITHRCIVCGHEKRNKAAPEDDADVLAKLSVAKTL